MRSHPRLQRVGKLVVVALLACTLASVPYADAHASLMTPVSRNVAYFTNAGPLPGQGAGAWLDAYGNGIGRSTGPTTYAFPAGNPGVCGDPFQMPPGTPGVSTSVVNFAGPVTTYNSGDVITTRVRLQVNHGGRITFRLCDRRTNLDQTCFNARVLNREGTTSPHFYILTGSWAATNAGTPEYANIRIKLPDGFSCPNGCVLQMEYFTYNTCLEQCPREQCGFYADRMNYIIPTAQGPKPLCGPGVDAPEIFRNCADIVITGGSTCPTPCPNLGTCQTGGGCNPATRTCNPIVNAANGSPCSGGTCQNGVCQPSTCPPCPTAGVCQQGGGCNTATRTCNPITNRPNGAACTGGTCQNGVCQTTPPPPTSDPCPGIAPGPARATCFCAAPRAPGRYQDVSRNCAGGFWCYPGGSQYITCAAGLMYDSRAGVCNWAAQVACTGAIVGPASVSGSNRPLGRRSPPSDVAEAPVVTAEVVAAAQPTAAAVESADVASFAATAAAPVVDAAPAAAVDSAFVAPDVAAAAATAAAPAIDAAAPSSAEVAAASVAEPTAAVGVAGVGPEPQAAGAAAVVTEAGAVAPDAATVVAP